MPFNQVRYATAIQAAFASAAAAPGVGAQAILGNALAAALAVEIADIVVSPLGTPPMTVAAAPGPVAGTGKLT